MNYLIKVVEDWRVPTVEDADALEAAFRKDGNYTVLKSVKTDKVVKAKGEIVQEYVLMQTTKVFNDVKEPDSDVTIEYR